MRGRSRSDGCADGTLQALDDWLSAASDPSPVKRAYFAGKTLEPGFTNVLVGGLIRGQQYVREGFKMAWPVR